jgi:hypothetical protein
MGGRGRRTTTTIGERVGRGGIPPSNVAYLHLHLHLHLNLLSTRARAIVAIIVIIVVVVAMGIVAASAATATAVASEHSAVLAVINSWFQPVVEARPAVEVAAAGHNLLSIASHIG